MAQTAKAKLEESRTAPLHLSDHPVELRFGFEQRQSSVGVGASMAAHLAFVALILIAIRFAPAPSALEFIPDNPIKDIVWLDVPGPGGGGGGGGNKQPEPPKPAEVKGREKISVPVKEAPKPIPDPPKPETPPEQLTIPAKSMAAAEVELPGVIAPLD